MLDWLLGTKIVTGAGITLITEVCAAAMLVVFMIGQDD
jgi:hypothetical protein